MNIKKTIWMAALMALFPSFLHAQGHFDWVKSYEGSNTSYDNTIVGKDVDSDGNIYIIGHFTPGAQINGVGLLPMTPYGFQCNTQCVIIAKLSSQGDLLWHKAIHANRDEDSRAIGIKCIGDSSIVCMADFTTPTSIQYLYLLDSLYTTVDTSSSTLSANTLMGGTLTGYFKFSTSGELQEKHLLTITYVDSLGQDIMGDRAYVGAPYSSLYYNSTLAIQRFAIDQDANIILDRITNDRMTLNGIESSVANGGISGIKILVDSCHHQLVLQNVMPFKEGNNQLIKVSPHFDSVMADNYLLALDPELDSYFQSTPTEMLTDSNGNVFVAAAFSTSEKGNYSIPLPGRPDLTFDIPATNYRKSLCVQFDKYLNPQHLLQLTESITDSSGIPHSYFWGMNFDDEGNLVILAALEKIWNNFYYDTTLLDIESDSSTLSHSLGFLRIDTAWNLVSYGFSMNTNWFSNGLPRSVVAKNNRILTEACYMYSFSTIDSIYQASHISHGVLSWDYDGRPISFIDYHSPGISDRMNGVILCDSILYMSGMFTAGANLQGVTVPAGAYLAKYVDSAFMAPYVYNDPRAEQTIDWKQDLYFALADSMAFLTATASSGLPVTYSCADTSIARVIGDTLYLLAEGITTVTASQSGDAYNYLPATPVTKTLSVGQVGIDNPGQQTLLAFPNPTHGDLFVNIPNERIVSIAILSSSGQCMKADLVGNRLSLASYPAGVYFLQIVTDNNKYHQKIIKL